MLRDIRRRKIRLQFRRRRWAASPIRTGANPPGEHRRWRNDPPCWWRFRRPCGAPSSNRLWSRAPSCPKTLSASSLASVERSPAARSSGSRRKNSSKSNPIGARQSSARHWPRPMICSRCGWILRTWSSSASAGAWRLRRRSASSPPSPPRIRLITREARNTSGYWRSSTSS
jgi:hypothetical protein